MVAEAAFKIPAWREGQRWTYHLQRTGRKGFEGHLTYTAQRLPDGAWRIEGESAYPEGRSLHEWLEVTDAPVRMRAAFFERRNPAGLVRYQARQAADGSLWVRTENDAGQREEQHDARRGPVYLANQLDFLLHGLVMTNGTAWSMLMRAEDGKVYRFEVRLVAREAPLVVERETVAAMLLTVKVAGNPLVRLLAPPARYWFHPRDQTMLLRLEHADSVLTLVDAT
jgi:hypothetical protein